MTGELAIVGAGAAGLMAAISAARARPGVRVLLLDGAKKLGAKILVSGGGRCNVTNVKVTPDDYRGASRNAIRKVLAAWTVEQTVRFFEELGVRLHEEEHGKLFPDSNSARTVVDALLDEAGRLGLDILTEHRVHSVQRSGQGFVLATSQGEVQAERVILATGGLSLPKTGSDGHGYELARSLGHTVTPPVPALAPLVLDGEFHRPLSGVSHEAELTLHVDGQKPTRLRGSLLWTHFGVSGPVVLDASGYWERARLEGKDVRVALNFRPGLEFVETESALLSAAAAHPKLLLSNAVNGWLPARVMEALLAWANVDGRRTMGQLFREERRRLVHALTEWPMPVRASRGYNYAEVTSGGVPLSEVHLASMESRCSKGLYLVGEILDVDGRIGGFNFQWAWSTGYLAGRAAAAVDVG